MKRFKSVIGLALVSALALFAVPTAAPAAGFISIPCYVDGSTNTQLVGASTLIDSVVLHAATNLYNLPNVTVSTNSWAAIPVPPQINLQAFQTLGVQYLFSCTLTNDKLLTFKFAGSADGSRWTSNIYTFTATANGTSVVNSTNYFNTGPFPFLALQAIENPNTTSDVTNLVVILVAKPGI